MLYFKDDKSREIVIKYVDKYEAHFDIDFPIFEYIESTDVTIEVAENLKELIVNSINKGEPVETPKDYHERLY